MNNNAFDDLINGIFIAGLAYFLLLKNTKTKMSLDAGYLVGLLLRIPFLIVKGLVKLFEVLFFGMKPEASGQSFMTPWEIFWSGILRTSNDGIKLDGCNALTREQSFKHVLCTAPSGSGKSSILVLPNLLTLDNCSIFATDPSGELYEKSASSLRQRNYRVLVLQPGDASRSLSFNPLHRAGANPTNLKKISQILVDVAYPETSPENNYWTQGASAIIFLLLKILVAQPDPRYRNLANVRYLASSFFAAHQFESGGALGELAAQYLDDLSFADFKAMLAEDQKTFSGRLSSALTALDPFADPQLAAMTSTDNIDLASFRKQKTAIFWITPTGFDTKFYRAIQTIFIAQLAEELLKNQGLDCFIFLDEFGNVGKLPACAELITTLRKFRVGIVAALQSVSQMNTVYGVHESQTILENFGTKVYFPGLPLAVTHDLEKILGKREIEEKSPSGHRSRKTVPLKSSAELRTMTENIAIIGNHHPIALNSKAWYQDSKLKRLGSFPPPLIEVSAGNAKVEYIPLNEERH